MLLLQQMIVLFIYMMIGYIACKKGKLDEAASSKLSWMVLNIANPMLVISAAVNGEGEIKGLDLIFTAAIAVWMFVILGLMAQVLPKLLRVEKKDIPLYKLMIIFNNMAFMGFPLISATYGNSALLYAAIFLLPFNILIYTYGVQVVKEDKAEKKFAWDKILNVGVISCIVAAVLYIGHIPVPQFVKTCSQGLGNLTGPLSMIVTGISLTKIKIKDLFTDVKLLVFSMIMLIIIPIAGTLLLKQVIDNTILCGTFMIIISTPVASMTLMLAESEKEDCEALVEGISLTTILSVITIPLVYAIVF